MKFQLVIPSGVVVDDDVESVTMPAQGGQRTILQGHDLLLTILEPGLLYYRKPGDEGRRAEYKLQGGFAEVTGGRVTVYALAPCKGTDALKELSS